MSYIYRFMRLKVVFFILLCSVIIKANAQGGLCPPSNIGFENGTFNGWSCDTGRVNGNGNLALISCQPVSGRQTMIDENYYPQVDPFGKFPTLCPYGGTHSIRLGNTDTSKRAESISYTFTVPVGVNQYNIIFYYAVVIQNPPHLEYQQPRFTVKTFNTSDNSYITCSSFDFIASDTLSRSGFKRSDVIADARKPAPVFYKDWTPATINLQGCAGKQVRLEFSTNDCTLGGHFGYAYLDVAEECGSPITGNSYCSTQNTVLLTAPGGFDQYFWYTPDLRQQLSVGQVYNISPPPPDGTKYAVVLKPRDGFGCVDTLYTTVTENKAPFTFKVTDSLFSCLNAGVDITAPAVTAGSDNNLKLSYFKDMDGLDYLYKPQDILTSGTYYIKAVNPQGCLSILPVTVVVANPIISVNDPPAVLYPVTVDISTTFPHQPNTTYNYFTNNTTTSQVADYQHIAHSGTYFIKAINKTGCVTIKPVNIVVTPPPPPVIKAANTFTPNNDGINDYFSLTITGYGAFGSVRIYNRYGQLTFESKSQDIVWDGRFNGRPAAPGTYYWIFDGINTYYRTKVMESGYITLIR